MEEEIKTTFSDKEIFESRKQALEEIKKLLSAEDVDAQFDDRTGDYFSKDKFIVTWKSNYMQYSAEAGIDKCDEFYKSFSGYKAIYVNRGLFHEKQLAGFASIEQALLTVGLKLCSTRQEKKDFFEKYAVPYNEKLYNQKKQC